MRKGLSPVISTIMVVAISLAAVGIVAYWYPKLVSSQTKDIEETSGNTVDCAFVDIDTYDPELNTTSNVLTFKVENTKQKSTTIKENIILYDNGTKISHNESVELKHDDLVVFAYNTPSNIDLVRTRTICSGKYDEIDGSDITTVS